MAEHGKSRETAASVEKVWAVWGIRPAGARGAQT